MKTHHIAVHFGNKTVGLMPEYFPAGNWIGTHLLHELLSLALSQDGLMAGDTSCATGELNDCIFRATVNDVSKSVETIKRTVQLLPFQVAVIEGSGPRCVYPSGDLRMAWLIDHDRHMVTSSQMIESMKGNLLRSIQGTKDGEEQK